MVHETLSKALSDAVKQRLLARNEAAFASPPSKKETRPPEKLVWSPKELARFLRSISHRHDYAMWRLVALTGVRRGELLGLRRCDVDWAHNTVSIAQAVVQVGKRLTFGSAKSDLSERKIPADPLTMAVLRDYLQREDDRLHELGLPERLPTRLVFCRLDGSPLRPSSVSNQFVKLVRRAGLPHLSLHGLRHTHASILLEAGANPKTVQERLGHASAAFTMDRYAHSFPARNAEAADRFAEMVDCRADEDDS
jgi:integrase